MVRKGQLIGTVTEQMKEWELSFVLQLNENATSGMDVYRNIITMTNGHPHFRNPLVSLTKDTLKPYFVVEPQQHYSFHTNYDGPDFEIGTNNSITLKQCKRNLFY